MTVSVRVCVDCGARPSAGGHRRCYPCQHARRKARDGYAGVPCGSCGVTMAGEYRAEKEKLCHLCRAERRERWKRDGRPCDDCGVPTGKGMRPRCGRCAIGRATRPCAVYQCGGKVLARGLCPTHYSYEWRRENGVVGGWGTWITPARRALIYRRDNWMCQICFDPIDREVNPNDDMAPSLDHIIPRSAGGGHESSNLRLAHRLCNSVRGAAVVV